MAHPRMDGLPNRSEASRLDGMANNPVLIAYTVKTLKSGKNVWTQIGAAYPTRHISSTRIGMTTRGAGRQGGRS